MINDVLEQLTEDYFRHLGYFTQHNIKYRPNKKGPAYAVNSDIDIVGVHPNKKGLARVVVASCKSWHGGLAISRDIERINNKQKKYHDHTVRRYRELAMPVWSKAFRDKIKQITGQSTFTYYLSCTLYDKAKKDLWENNKIFHKNLKNCSIKLIDMETMIKDVWSTTESITPAHSELSRLLQMIRHSGGKLEY